MKELKYRKNSKFEIEFTNLDEIKEGDNVILRLKNGDLSPLFYLDCEFTRFKIFFICGIFNDYQLQQIVPILKNHNECIFYFFDIDNFELFLQIEKKNNFVNSNVQFKNIFPKWNIPEDSAVLFLNEESYEKYSANYNTYFTYPDCINAINIIEQNGIDDVDCIKYYKTISIIVPELHCEDKSCKYHIENINNVCKEVKEKYRVEKIELFVSHCFLRVDDISLFCYQENGKMCMSYKTFYGLHIEPLFRYLNFDFLTTTNSTQKIEAYNQSDRNESNEFYKKEKNNYESRLEVIDIVEFFNI